MRNAAAWSGATASGGYMMKSLTYQFVKQKLELGDEGSLYSTNTDFNKNPVMHYSW